MPMSRSSSVIHAHGNLFVSLSNSVCHVLPVKDLVHASDEVEFYGRVQRMLEADLRWQQLANVTMKCPGVCHLNCFNPKDDTHEMLVQRVIGPQSCWRVGAGRK
eukprot:5204650-Amphidinium_carterae.1